MLSVRDCDICSITFSYYDTTSPNRRFCSRECSYIAKKTDRIGMKFMKEHRENLSKAHKGKEGYWTGKKRSKEVIEKLRMSHIGKKQSEETRLKRMLSGSGDKHYNWKNGITPLVRQVRRCFKYRQWRNSVFIRDDFTCVCCDKRGGWMEAHHIKSFSIVFNINKIETIQQALDCKELWDINNGVTLCKDCHDKTKKKIVKR